MGHESHTVEQDLVNPYRVAIDFETLALSSRAAIIGVAAASFGEPEGPTPLFNAWPIACSPGDTPTFSYYEQPGREIDERTIDWHKGQPTWPTTQAALDGQGSTLVNAMRELFAYIDAEAEGRPVVWYSRPGAFDGAILLDVCRWAAKDIGAFETPLGAGIPLHRRVRCMRTLQQDACMFRPVLWRQPTTAHDPASDVLADATSAHECLELLRQAKEGLEMWGEHDQIRQILEEALRARGLDPNAGRGLMEVVRLAAQHLTKREPDTETPAGHAYPADRHHIDVVRGVTRYRRNKIVNDLVDDAVPRRGAVALLNCIVIAQREGRYSLEELAELYRLTGYSISGFADVFPQADHD